MWNAGLLDLQSKGQHRFSQYQQQTCRETSINMLPNAKSVYGQGLSDSTYQWPSRVPYNFNNEPKSEGSSADAGVVIGFGQTEWMRMWADQIYQFKRPAPAEAAKVKEKAETSTRFRNDLSVSVRFPVESTNQDWKTSTRFNVDGGGRSGNREYGPWSQSRKVNSSGKQRFDNTKVRRDGFNNYNRSNELMNTLQQSGGTSFQRKKLTGFGDKNNAAENAQVPETSTKRRIVHCNNAQNSSSNDWQERAKRRKMRFENNLDVTLIGADSSRTKTRRRAIVIDGNNVAYNYGEDFYFDWEGIRICAKHFKDLECDNVIIVVSEIKLAPGMTKNQPFGEQLKKTYTLTPCPENANYNQFLLKIANKMDALVISNGVWDDKKKIAVTYHHLIDKTVNYHFDTHASSIKFVTKILSKSTGPTLEELLRLQD